MHRLSKDLVKFGLIPELVGRIPVITSLENLDVDGLVNIITQPKNALLKQYKSLLKMDKVELDFTDEAIKRVAELTIERETGARGLRSIMESVLIPIMYKVPSEANVEAVKVTADVVDGKAKPTYIKKPKENKAV